MLIPLTAEISDSLASKICEVALYPSLDGTLAKRQKLLPMLLTIENCCFERGGVKVICYQGQSFECNRCYHSCPRGAVEGE